jgi:beta-lactamase class A
MGSTAIDLAEREITRIALRAKASVGMCAIHVESEKRIAINSESRFPMFSTYKVPIAVSYLSLAEAAGASLDQPVEIMATDLSGGSGTIAALIANPGTHLSPRSLLELMLRVSDNTASNVILRLAGGPVAVTSFMRTNGIADLRVDRSTKALLCSFYGISGAPSERQWSLDSFNARVAETTPDSRSAARTRFLDDPRDTCTPAAMATLLAGLHRRNILNDAQSELLLSIMNRCETGPARLKGGLPPGTPVAHKTGSLEGCGLNDAGIIRLPDDLGCIAIAVFVKGEAPVDEYERVIRHIARTVYDCFLFSASDT